MLEKTLPCDSDSTGREGEGGHLGARTSPSQTLHGHLVQRLESREEGEGEERAGER